VDLLAGRRLDRPAHQSLDEFRRLGVYMFGHTEQLNLEHLGFSVNVVMG
jgi:hypothetical protein